MCGLEKGRLFSPPPPPPPPLPPTSPSKIPGCLRHPLQVWIHHPAVGGWLLSQHLTSATLPWMGCPPLLLSSFAAPTSWPLFGDCDKWGGKPVVLLSLPSWRPRQCRFRYPCWASDALQLEVGVVEALLSSNLDLGSNLWNWRVKKISFSQSLFKQNECWLWM